MVFWNSAGLHPTAVSGSCEGFVAMGWKKPASFDFPVVKFSRGALTPVPPARAYENEGPIAQSVEQWIENSRVGGSNPSRATFSDSIRVSCEAMPISNFEATSRKIALDPIAFLDCLVRSEMWID
jgi:hypothetical protein